jgi:ADP-heptose:LPS heptosyltransferase
MIRAAAAAIGVPAHRCVVVGDIGTDMQAALAAGASGVLVPTPQTLPGEIAAAPAVAEHLLGAVEWILYRQTLGAPAAAPATPGRHVLVVRPDSIGDTLLTGPAIRAIAATAGRVTLWCGRRGAAAGRLLPGVDDVLEWTVPWIDAEPERVDASAVGTLVDTVRGLRADEAIIFTSYHQSPLPTALLLRLAGLARISAISVDYPGSLLDLRHSVADGLPEPERALSLAAAAGYSLPDGDDGRLAVDIVHPDDRDGRVVLHAGSNAPARSIPAELTRRLVARLRADGRPVVLTGEPGDRPPPDSGVTDLRGRTDLAQLAALLAGSACLVTGNSGPAHLAAAVGTPVVSLYAPTVPFGRWQPYRVPVVRVGDPLAPCRDSRVSVCRTPTQHCLSTVDPAIVIEAVARLIGERR